ncbi:MAG: sporulation protein [Ruminococcus sp.]|nr:sporulation protein [Ruminococcus sp.]
MKKIGMLILVLITAVLICPTVCASQEGADRITQQVNERLEEILDEDTKEYLRENSIDAQGAEAASQLDEAGVFSRLWKMFTDALAAPWKMLVKLMGIAAAYGALSALRNEGSSTDKVFGVVCRLSMAAAVSGSISAIFEKLRESVEAVNTFMISYIPLFSAVTTAGGAPVTAGSYSAGTLLVCEVSAWAASGVMMPLLSAVTAMTMVSAIDPRLTFAGAAQTIKKLVCWLLASVSMIFTGLMSIKGISAAAADNLAAKTLRFAASSFIPVIGATVNDAFAAVKGSVGVIRSATGVIGIVGVFFIAARPLLLILAMRLMLWAGQLINELMGLKDCAEMLKNLGSVMGIAGAILLTLASVFIVSTALVMRAAGGA